MTNWINEKRVQINMRSITITADDILAYAPSVEGNNLRTLHERKEFTCEAKSDHLIYTPKKTGKARKHDKVTLQRICDTFSKTNSLKPKDYVKLTRNASYSLALIAKYLGAVVDGRLAGIDSP